MKKFFYFLKREVFEQCDFLSLSSIIQKIKIKIQNRIMEIQCYQERMAFEQTFFIFIFLGYDKAVMALPYERMHYLFFLIVQNTLIATLKSKESPFGVKQPTAPAV
jgi:hypothetical protein